MLTVNNAIFEGQIVYQRIWSSLGLALLTKIYLMLHHHPLRFNMTLYQYQTSAFASLSTYFSVLRFLMMLLHFLKAPV